MLSARRIFPLPSVARPYAGRIFRPPHKIAGRTTGQRRHRSRTALANHVHKLNPSKHPSAAREATLKAPGGRVQIERKGSAIKPLSQTQQQRNRRIASPRARVEHAFGAMRHMGEKPVRCMGIVRATFALPLKTANYLLQRLVYLKKRAYRRSETQNRA